MTSVLDESQFHLLADAVLARFFERLEPAYEHGGLDELELQGGILTLVAASGRTYLVTKHTPTRQIWFASPVSGGLHFAYQGGIWCLTDGRTLEATVAAELGAEHIEAVL